MNISKAEQRDREQQEAIRQAVMKVIPSDVYYHNIFIALSEVLRAISYEMAVVERKREKNNG